MAETDPATTTAWGVGLGDAHAAWPESKRLEDARLLQLLQVGQEACESYAPSLPVGATPPASWREAVVLQARDVASAATRDGTDVVGFDAYAVRVRPLSATVRQLLRPRRGVPVVG